IDLGSFALTVGDNVGNDTIAGVVQGTGGSLVKSGSDTLTLSGTNAYTGATVVSAGSLLVNGSLTSAASVATGATLGGSGIVGAAPSLASNSGTVNTGSPGADATLTVGNLVLGGGTLMLNLDGLPSYDSVKVTGSTLDLTNTVLSLAITPSAIHPGDHYTIIS